MALPADALATLPAIEGIIFASSNCCQDGMDASKSSAGCGWGVLASQTASAPNGTDTSYGALGDIGHISAPHQWAQEPPSVPAPAATAADARPAIGPGRPLPPAVGVAGCAAHASCPHTLARASRDPPPPTAVAADGGRCDFDGTFDVTSPAGRPFRAAASQCRTGERGGCGAAGSSVLQRANTDTGPAARPGGGRSPPPPGCHARMHRRASVAGPSLQQPHPHYQQLPHPQQQQQLFGVDSGLELRRSESPHDEHEPWAHRQSGEDLACPAPAITAPRGPPPHHARSYSNASEPATQPALQRTATAADGWGWLGTHAAAAAPVAAGPLRQPASAGGCGRLGAACRLGPPAELPRDPLLGLDSASTLLGGADGVTGGSRDCSDAAVAAALERGRGRHLGYSGGAPPASLPQQQPKPRVRSQWQQRTLQLLPHLLPLSRPQLSQPLPSPRRARARPLLRSLQSQSPQLPQQQRPRQQRAVRRMLLGALPLGRPSEAEASSARKSGSECSVADSAASTLLFGVPLKGEGYAMLLSALTAPGRGSRGGSARGGAGEGAGGEACRPQAGSGGGRAGQRAQPWYVAWGCFRAHAAEAEESE